MKKLMIICVAVMSTMVGFAANEKPPTIKCLKWTDTGSNVVLPEMVADMKLLSRIFYDQDNYSFTYESEEFHKGEIGRRLLSAYIYWPRLTEDGTRQVTLEEEHAAVVETVKARPDLVGDFSKVEVLEGAKESVIAGEKALTTTFNHMVHPNVDGNLDEMCRGFALMTKINGYFFKLRYTESFKNTEETGTRWPEILSAFTAALEEAKKTREVDVYAIEEDGAAFEALKAKWKGAPSKVSQWELPKYDETFDEIDQCQDWCQENPSERYPEFEKYIRLAIELQMEPDIWYYNLACAHAMQGRKEAAIEALEKAMVAGYVSEEGKVEHALNDSDLESVREDVRFKRLLRLAEIDLPNNKKFAIEPAKIEKDMLKLNEKNVYYGEGEHYYCVKTEVKTGKEVFYLNGHKNHPLIPKGDLVTVVFPEEAREVVCAKGFPNAYVTTGEGEAFCGLPIIVACDELDAAFRDFDAVNHGVFRGVIPIFSRGATVWNCPHIIAHSGDEEESDKFVTLITKIIGAMPRETYSVASVLMPTILREAQKEPNDSMLLSYDNIDEEKALQIAARIKSNEDCCDYLQPVFTGSGDCVFYTNLFYLMNGETGFEVEISEEVNREMVWEAREEAANFVKITPSEDGTQTKVELSEDCPYNQKFEITVRAKRKDGTITPASIVNFYRYKEEEKKEEPLPDFTLLDKGTSIDYSEGLKGYTLPLGFRIKENIAEYVSQFTKQEHPESLKMKLAQYAPSDKDLWKVDDAAIEVELKKVYDEKLAGSLDSVFTAYRAMSEKEEELAISEFDKHFPRYKNRRDNKVWVLGEDYIVMVGKHPDEPLPCRDFVFAKLDPSTGKIIRSDYVSGFPTKEIANTILRAFECDPIAINNVAVFMYASLADKRDFDPEEIDAILKLAEEAGVEEAKRNREILKDFVKDSLSDSEEEE